MGIDELTDKELKSFSAAVDVARGATTESFIHSEPIRDEAGRFCELRVRRGSNVEQVLLVVPIDNRGRPQAAMVAT